MKVPRVKAKDTMPIMPEIRKKGEVVAVVDTTTPMIGRDRRSHPAYRLKWVFCGYDYGAAIVLGLLRSIVQYYMFASCRDEVNNDLLPERLNHEEVHYLRFGTRSDAVYDSHICMHGSVYKHIMTQCPSTWTVTPIRADPW
jgi:hypothetical protein